ncbi:hypothetical protein [Pendulispora albinea]|uniref:DUF4143 domain-containing protein n=1 Tax=Pendulispora albinea TaxID=2741071 RepID=A0ABZ2LWS3_9BACT
MASRHSYRFVLLLRRAELARRGVVERLVARLEHRAGKRAELACAFAFKDSEYTFARELAERTHLWIYRVHQRAFGGDFIVVDVSSPDPERRTAIALDLKRGRDVREDRPGIQMRCARRVIASIAESGVVGKDCQVAYLTGDARSVLRSIDETIRRNRARALQTAGVSRSRRPSAKSRGTRSVDSAKSKRVGS